MNTRIVNALIVAALSVALAVPALGAETNVIDVKKVEAQIIAAQNQVVGGNLDAGLKALQEARTQAVTAELAARAEFVGKLAEVRMAEKLGDQAKVLAALNEAARQARQPDQIEGLWHTGLAVAQATVAAKGNAAPVIDFLAKGPGPAMKQFMPYIEVARLHTSTKNPGAAEADLVAAAPLAKTPTDWSTWVGCVDKLAALADGGQAPNAGADMFERVRDAAQGVGARVKLDVAEGRFLLKRGLLSGIEAVVGRELKKDVPDEDMVSAVSLYYEVAAASQRAKDLHASERFASMADEVARKVSVSAAQCSARGVGLRSLGLHAQAAQVYWDGFQAVADAKQKAQLLAAYCDAAVAAGTGDAALAALREVKAPVEGYVALAKAYQGTANSVAALRVLNAVTGQLATADPKTVQEITSLGEKIKAAEQKNVRDLAAMYEAMAKSLDAAAKKADESNDTKAASDYRARAEALRAMAKELVQ